MKVGFVNINVRRESFFLEAILRIWWSILCDSDSLNDSRTMLPESLNKAIDRRNSAAVSRER